MPKREPAEPDTMLYWIARHVRELRASKHVERKEILQIVGVDPSTLSNFEAAKNWPHQIEQLVVAYAALCGVDDPRRLWAQAANRYLTAGTIPVLETVPLSPQVRALLLAAEAGQRTRPYDAESRDTPNAKIPRRAEGR